MGKPGSVAATVRKTGSTRFQKAANGVAACATMGAACWKFKF